MKNITPFLGTAALLLAGCSGSGVTVRGDIAAGGSGKTIVVERVVPTGARFVDSVRTDRNGNFNLFIEQEPGVPEFYNLRIAGGGNVPLLADASEKIVVRIADSTARRYDVTGSAGSALVQEANDILAQADPVARKQAAAGFISRHAGSLAAIVPLYQTAADGSFVFADDVTDVVYFGMVSDSLNNRYPGSPYALALAADVQGFENAAATGRLLAENMDNVVSFPDLDLPDALGKRHKLSDLGGKVILLSFTASNLPELKILNRELVEVHNRHAAQGFEVYQVSLDTDKAQWIRSVAEQRLPWISVSDQLGGDSPAVRLYNVQKIPANFLIDREGNIVRRNVPPTEIEAAVKELL
ncbi:peroxiredoxin family protein [Rikenella microfusus]|uniref:peroxiredoxin family protein n=1 Tax=Rikenella microfusus TaxID=28139 RepID=UPI001DE82810|nr:TlpA disulfide reductase family protein [Rikenella microfusus]HJE87917.1 TlpA family protein disulfide reductase [Rikenella microfusus]